MRETAPPGEDEQKVQLRPLPESQQVSDKLSIAEKPALSLVAPATMTLPVVPSTPPYEIHTELEVQVPPSLSSPDVTAEPIEDIHTYRVTASGYDCQTEETVCCASTLVDRSEPLLLVLVASGRKYW